MKIIKSIFPAGDFLSLLLVLACNDGNQNDRDDTVKDEMNDGLQPDNQERTPTMHHQLQSWNYLLPFVRWPLMVRVLIGFQKLRPSVILILEIR